MLEKHDQNKDGVISLNEFEEVSRDYYRGFDANRDGTVEKSDYDVLVASITKGENVLLAIKAGGGGNITQSHIAWNTTRGLPYVASPLLYDGLLYTFMNGGMISSFDAQTGKPFYLPERLNAEGSYYSSPVAADGRIYVASLPGTLTVIKAGGDKPEILHQSSSASASTLRLRLRGTTSTCARNPHSTLSASRRDGELTADSAARTGYRHHSDSLWPSACQTGGRQSRAC